MSSNSTSLNISAKLKKTEVLMCRDCGYEIETAQIPGKKSGLRCPQCSSQLLRMWR